MYNNPTKRPRAAVNPISTSAPGDILQFNVFEGKMRLATSEESNRYLGTMVDLVIGSALRPQCPNKPCKSRWIRCCRVEFYFWELRDETAQSKEQTWNQGICKTCVPSGELRKCPCWDTNALETDRGTESIKAAKAVCNECYTTKIWRTMEGSIERNDVFQKKLRYIQRQCLPRSSIHSVKKRESPLR